MSVDAEHVLVAGPSGGGKTTYLRELHAQHDGPSIFLTTKGNERKAKDNPPARVKKSSASYPKDIQRARAWAKRKNGTVQVVIDEVQNAPTFHGENGPVKDMLHEDRGDKLKAVIATQNPQDLHTRQFKYGPIQQAKYWVFVGKGKDWHAGFFDGNNLNSVKQYVPDEMFEYIVIDPALAKTGEEKVLYRGRTNKKYG